MIVKKIIAKQTDYKLSFMGKVISLPLGAVYRQTKENLFNGGPRSQKWGNRKATNCLEYTG